MTNNNPARTLIAAIGEDDLIRRFGITPRNIRHAKSVGRFASHWYLPFKDYAESKGIHCPPEAFFWKPFANKRGGANSDIQGQASK